MITLFLDVETDGLPKSYKALPSIVKGKAQNVENWPRVMQLAFVVMSGPDQVIHTMNRLILPPDGGFAPVTDNFVRSHSEDECREKGVPITEALDELAHWALQADEVVAHNMSFDRPVLQAEFIRAGMAPKITGEFICTMFCSIDVCKIPGQLDYKWPKLTELHTHLFGEGFEGAHDGLADVQACARCFWKLREMGRV
jgi:DNA polymerase III epsilon subunit-like protein